MRVTVNYGIDFEDIPDLLQDILSECESLNNKAESLLGVVSYALSKDDSRLLMEAVHDLRLSLTQIDLKIGDFAEMSSGFIKAKNKMAEPQPEPEPQPNVESGTVDSQGEVDLGVPVPPIVDDVDSQ